MKNLLLVLFVFAGFASMAQQKINADQLSSDWTLLAVQNGVELYVQKSDCKVGNVEKPFTYGFLKVVNTTSEEKNVSFNIHLFYTDGCAGCDNPNEEYKYVNVPANESISTDCNFENGQLALLIRNPLQTDLQEFTHLSLIDLKVD